MVQVTVDAGLMRERELHPSLQILKNWEAQGKIEIFETDRARGPEIQQGWPGGVKPQKTFAKYRTAPKKPAGGLSFQNISSVLFPTRDPNKLNMTEVNDVAHLIRHHSAGRSFFITTNTKDFMADGKRERLQAVYKIVVLTPEEAVFVIENYEKQQQEAKLPPVTPPAKAAPAKRQSRQS